MKSQVQICLLTYFSASHIFHSIRLILVVLLCKEQDADSVSLPPLQSVSIG